MHYVNAEFGNIWWINCCFIHYRTWVESLSASL